MMQVKEQAVQNAAIPKNEYEDKLKKLRSSVMIFRILCLLLSITIVIMSVIKYNTYFTPEKVKNEPDAKLLSEAEPDYSAMRLMNFNSDLTVADRDVLFVNSNNNSAEFDLISPERNNVLVRAEIYVDKDHLHSNKIKRMFHGIVYKNDDSLVRIGDTGWLRPGEILSELKFDELPDRSSEVTVHYTAVNPLNEKVNAGTFDISTMLYVVDFKGNMLDENGNWVKAG